MLVAGVCMIVWLGVILDVTILTSKNVFIKLIVSVLWEEQV